MFIFLPALWIFSYFVPKSIGAGITCIFLIGRPIYRAEYANYPSKRDPCYVIGSVNRTMLLLGGDRGTVYRFLLC